jgi:hypothetical protein
LSLALIIAVAKTFTIITTITTITNITTNTNINTNTTTKTGCVDLVLNLPCNVHRRRIDIHHRVLAYLAHRAHRRVAAERE